MVVMNATVARDAGLLLSELFYQLPLVGDSVWLETSHGSQLSQFLLQDTHKK